MKSMGLCLYIDREQLKNQLAKILQVFIQSTERELSIFVTVFPYENKQNIDT